MSTTLKAVHTYGDLTTGPYTKIISSAPKNVRNNFKPSIEEWFVKNECVYLNQNQMWKGMPLVQE